MMKFSIIKINKKHILSLLVVLVFYAINPFFTLIFLIFLSLINNIDEDFHIQLIIVLFSIFLGLINITKVPESDLANYQIKFLSSGSISNILKYIELNVKSPVYALLSWTFYHLISKNFSLFLLFVTTCSYLIIFKALVRFYTCFNFNKTILIFSILFIAFYPSFFLLSAHLIRQIFAGAIFIYYLTDYLCTKKYKWWLLFFAILIHGSILILSFFSILKISRKRISLKKILIILLISLPIFLYYRSVAEFFSHIFNNHTYLHYIFDRISNKMTEVSSGKLGITSSVFLFLISLKIIYVVYFTKPSLKIVWFFNIILFLIITIIFTLNQPLLSLRLFFYIYIFSPFIIMVFLSNFKNNLTFKLAISSCILILFLAFSYAINYGTFQYNSLLEIYLGNITKFFF